MEAKAPYNFIPLNSKVITYDAPADFDKYQENKHSGYIMIDFITKTPFYIRGTADGEGKTCEFFAPGGIKKIPGSSIRGMVRTLVEIVSGGKFSFLEKDKRLYFRAVGESGSLGKYYRNLIKMSSVYAGVIKNKDNKYIICPSNKFYKIRGQFIEKSFVVKYNSTNIVVEEFGFKEDIYFKEPKKNNLVFEIRDSKHDNYIKGYLVASGNIIGKNIQWIVGVPDTKHYLLIRDKVIKLYKSDNNRKKEADLLKKLETHNRGVPCFYIKEGNEVRAFGHTPYFRIPYDCSIGEHVPCCLTDDNLTDMAESIFGKPQKWASRVFFEDAEICPNQKDVSLELALPKILSTPKPTSFQHYLEQTSDGDKKHWNNKDANIRGYKLFWHRKTPCKDNDKRQYGWSERTAIDECQKPSDEVHTLPIKPIKEGTKFKGRIRFENLSSVELGALLFVLDLPDESDKVYCHKLGLGKPLGLGSVKITPKLFIIDRKKRYSSLFDGGDIWALAEREYGISEYIDNFEKDMLDKMSPEDRGSASKLWNTSRLAILKMMLDWKKAENGGDDWLEKTRYMSIDNKEFKERAILQIQKPFIIVPLPNQ
ncbi:MAG: TIGR03986 family CRISPR-associated RAMP protein [Candidatus Magnetoovum sp. WYHC-5]|nr:TIGR03986 family CRISPR-associated RAMP protein [Candidatus Magnetoovum sp. WYHC-5]